MLRSTSVQAGEFSDQDFVQALAGSGARVLIIGRRALILLGAPVLTADYDLWVHFDDIEKLNTAFAGLDHEPNRLPDEARRTGRYVLENGEHVDVMVARAKPDTHGQVLDFDSAWERRQTIHVGPGLAVHLPSLEDLITTKRWASRPRDMVDIQYLEQLRRRSDA